MKKQIISLAVASCLFSSFAALPASAQESQTFVPPGSTWENKAEQRIKILNQQSLKQKGGFVPQELQMSIVHYDYMESDQFGILMKTPETVTGCFDISPIGYEAKFVGDLYMDINVTSYNITPIKTQNVQYACNQGYRAATGLIVLSADDLRARGTRQIRFTNGQARDNYNIIMSNDSITLQPESMIVFKAKNGNLSYGTNPMQIVALDVPMAKEGDDVAQAVRALAAQKGLNPITDAQNLPKEIKDIPNRFYFLDETGRYSEAMDEKGYLEIGMVPAPRTFVDENGRSQKNVPLKVFVTSH